MTNEQINIAIEEACGWQINKYKYLAKPPNEDWQYKDKIPDYCNDLNAMHEAQKMLNSEQWVAYGKELSRLKVFPMVHATARQKAEAFLRTLGKWEE
jgi:hypothetical protein